MRRSKSCILLTFYPFNFILFFSPTKVHCSGELQFGFDQEWRPAAAALSAKSKPLSAEHKNKHSSHHSNGKFHLSSFDMGGFSIANRLHTINSIPSATTSSRSAGVIGTGRSNNGSGGGNAGLSIINAFNSSPTATTSTHKVSPSASTSPTTTTTPTFQSMNNYDINESLMMTTASCSKISSSPHNLPLKYTHTENNGDTMSDFFGNVSYASFCRSNIDDNKYNNGGSSNGSRVNTPQGDSSHSNRTTSMSMDLNYSTNLFGLAGPVPSTTDPLPYNTDEFNNSEPFEMLSPYDAHTPTSHSQEHQSRFSIPLI